MQDIIKVIFENEGIIALNKPAGYETISLTGGKCLTTSLRMEKKDKNIFPVHRLDKDTTGVQIFATNLDAKEELERLFKYNLIEKSYLAICIGVPLNKTGNINRRLSAWQGGHKPVKVLTGNKGLNASTFYQKIIYRYIKELSCSLSLLEFKPKQGRTHQIRVHASSLGYPILADDQYGDRNINKIAKKYYGLKRQALHASSVNFNWHKNEIKISAELLADMEKIIKVLY